MSFRPPAGDTALRRLARRALPLGLRTQAMRLAGPQGPPADVQFVRDDVDDRLSRAEELLDTLELHGRIPATTAWIELGPLQPDVLVSVITATRNRRDQLENALASVQAQSHPQWEHIVVDDGSEDDTPTFLSGVADRRCRTLRTVHAGLGSARNAALDSARGSIIVYLDDDNLMHPGWLRAVVWAFGRLSATDFLYGARVVEDWSAQAGTPSGEMPRIELVPYDRSRHERVNIIDANVMAHRAGLAEARFAEDMHGVEDWDLGLRLAALQPPLALPAIACMYQTLSENRLCDTDTLREAYRLLRARAHTRRPMRVLVAGTDPDSAHGERLRLDVNELLASGAEVALHLTAGRLEPLPSGVTVLGDLRTASRTVDPDVVLAHRGTRSRSTVLLPPLPYVVRVASGDPPARDPAGDALCIGEIGPAHPAEGLAGTVSRLLAAYRYEHPHGP